MIAKMLICTYIIDYQIHFCKYVQNVYIYLIQLDLN